METCLLPTIASLLILTVPVRAEVHTVGPPGSGADFTAIQAAIDAAAAGDVVRVDAGLYDAFTLDKPLLVVGAGPGATFVRGALFVGTFSVRVQGIAAGEVAAVSGMTADKAPLGAVAYLVEVEQCAGTVVLHSLVANGTPLDSGGLFVKDAERVLVSDSTVLGGGLDQPWWAGDAFFTLAAENARLWVSSSTIWLEPVYVITYLAHKDTLGLTASELHLAAGKLLGCNIAPTGNDSDGGTAASLRGASLLTLRGSECLGGNGVGPGGVPPGDGGHAALVIQSSTVLVDTATTFEGGFNGPGTVQQSAAGVLPGSQVIHDPATLPTLSASPASVSAGDQLVLSFTGEAGAAGLLFASLHPGPGASIPGIDGEVFLDLGAFVPLGPVSLDGAGQAALPLMVPTFGLDPTLVTFQWLATATGTASNAAVVSLL